MDTRPNIKEYKSPFAAIVPMIVGVISLIVGIVVVIIGVAINQEGVSISPGFTVAKVSIIVIGIIAILSAAFFFGLSDIIDDIHHQDYLTRYYGEEAHNFYMQELQMLQNIETMLKQQSPQQEHRPETSRRNVLHDSFVDL